MPNMILSEINEMANFENICELKLGIKTLIFEITIKFMLAMTISEINWAKFEASANES